MPETAIPVTDEPRKSVIKALHPLQKADIMAFLKAKGAKLECPSCSKKKWKVNVPSEEGFTEVTMSATSVASFGTFYYVEPPLNMVVLECEHCAHIRLHNGLVIAAWKASTPAP